MYKNRSTGDMISIHCLFGEIDEVFQILDDGYIPTSDEAERIVRNIIFELRLQYLEKLFTHKSLQNLDIKAMTIDCLSVMVGAFRDNSREAIELFDFLFENKIIDKFTKVDSFEYLSYSAFLSTSMTALQYFKSKGVPPPENEWEAELYAKIPPLSKSVI